MRLAFSQVRDQGEPLSASCADLARVLGEAVALFEPGEPDRTVQLPHAPAGQEKTLQLSPNLLVLGTRNTADRIIARMDIAIRRRFAFVEMLPDLAAVKAEGEKLATGAFAGTVYQFSP